MSDTPRTNRLRKRKYANNGRRIAGLLEAHESEKAPIVPEVCKYPEECKHYGYCIRPGDHDHPAPCQPRSAIAPMPEGFERCPIGLDASPTICSAGTCTPCRAWREYMNGKEYERYR